MSVGESVFFFVVVGFFFNYFRWEIMSVALLLPLPHPLAFCCFVNSVSGVNRRGNTGNISNVFLPLTLFGFTSLPQLGTIPPGKLGLLSRRKTSHSRVASSIPFSLHLRDQKERSFLINQYDVRIFEMDLLRKQRCKRYKMQNCYSYHTSLIT